MANTKQHLTYSAAVQEVETILQQIEYDEIDMDTLPDKVKRALTLLKFCSECLHSVEEQLNGRP